MSRQHSLAEETGCNAASASAKDFCIVAPVNGNTEEHKQSESYTAVGLSMPSGYCGPGSACRLPQGGSEKGVRNLRFFVLQRHES
jgi:hypothetical protein